MDCLDKFPFQVKRQIQCFTSRTSEFTSRPQIRKADDTLVWCVHLCNVQMNIVLGSGFDFWRTRAWNILHSSSSTDSCIGSGPTASANKGSSIFICNSPHIHLRAYSSCLSALAFQVTHTKSELREKNQALLTFWWNDWPSLRIWNPVTSLFRKVFHGQVRAY